MLIPDHTAKSIPGKNCVYISNNQGDYYLVLQMILNTGLCLSKSHKYRNDILEQVQVYSR